MNNLRVRNMNQYLENFTYNFQHYFKANWSRLIRAVAIKNEEPLERTFPLDFVIFINNLVYKSFDEAQMFTYRLITTGFCVCRDLQFFD